MPTRTGDFADELDELETLISSNKQREKSPSQIAREGSELQRIEAERAKKRQLANLKNQDVVETNLSKRGSSDEHVAAELGMSMTQWKKLKTIFERAKSGDAVGHAGKPPGRTTFHKRMKIVIPPLRERLYRTL